MNLFDEIVLTAGKIIWGPHMLILLIGTGLYVTIRLKGIQFQYFFYAVNCVISGFKKSDKSGDITSIQALMTSLGSIVGNANIVGIATAIAIGGPGAIFWMWIAAVVGMATKFCEVVLGVYFRKFNQDGSVFGGPMLYLQEIPRKKMFGKILAGFFAFAMATKALLATTMTNSNSMAYAVDIHLGIAPWITGIVIAVLTWIVIIGGIKNIARILEIFSPFMSLLYISAGMAVIIIHAESLPEIIGKIISEAFSGTAAVGGFAGSTMVAALRFGVARGAYSNEAGIGSAAVAHAAAKTDQPVRQGLIAMMDVFIDTILICTITGLVILITGEWIHGATGAELSRNAFDNNIPFGGWVVVLSSLLFGYSSMISYAYLGEQAFAYLCGFKIKKYFGWAYCIFIFCGSFIKVETVWFIGDICIGLMAVPNLIGLIALSGVIFKLTRTYFNTHKEIEH